MSITSKRIERINPPALPPPPDARTALAYQRLTTTAGSPDWLPAGQFEELDRLRDEHHRHLRQVNEGLAALAELDAAHRDGDREQTEALRDAHRRSVKPPDDERPTPAEREAQRAPLVENVHAAVVTLAELVERTIEMIREHEDEWLASVRARVPVLEEKRREAQRLVAEARTEEWRNDRLARWLRATADDIGFAPVPLDQVREAPESWRPDPNTLKRHWSELKPWNERSPEDDVDVSLHNRVQRREGIVGIFEAAVLKPESVPWVAQ